MNGAHIITKKFRAFIWHSFAEQLSAMNCALNRIVVI